MKSLFFFLIFGLSLFGQSASSLVAPASNGSVAIFSITPLVRGSDLIAMFGTLTTSPYKLNQSQVAIQTTRNGLILNVTAIASATNGTILIISYLPPTSPTVTQYIAVPVEQIVEMIYSTQAISSGALFTSTVPGGILPIFSVDASLRALDIQSVFNTLDTKSPYVTATSTVSLQTTLGGSYTLATTGMPTLVGGKIPNVQSIALTTGSLGAMLLVTYLVGSTVGTVVVTPDQVYGIIYTP